MLLEETRAAPQEEYKEFEEFLSNPINSTKGITLGRGEATTIESGSGRKIRSTSSRSDSLADLFAFGAFPTNYDTDVHHLHGRIDDPKNLVITPKDYQKVYYGNSDQKRSFEEARHAVFTGSDVLLYGMGTEPDVL